ncbi:MAG: DUF4172 domain-containing protein [Aquabacterium sp.]|nr:DUF4172 domain-containing protein [Aquabacterium sp.]
MTTSSGWIWQRPDWPSLTYEPPRVAIALANAHRMHGIVEDSSEVR